MSYFSPSIQDKIILDLVVGQNSSDNNVRTGAEIQFNEFVSKDPSAATHSLIRYALDQEGNFPIDIRQSCLLHLKRCIPKYWSMGFRSFIGPPVQQELKGFIRDQLLNLATTSEHSKIRNGAAYVIVQIAAADFPDEWPNLLQNLYELTTNTSDQVAIVGGITVLNDLFDDLITEEQFWEGRVGSELINHVMELLQNDELADETKTHVVSLYQNILKTLQLQEAFETDSRKQAVSEHIGLAMEVFLKLLERAQSAGNQAGSDKIHLTNLHFRGNLYKVLNEFVSLFNKKVKYEQKKWMMQLIMTDLNSVGYVYNNIAVRGAPKEQLNLITTADLVDPKLTTAFLLIELVLALTALQHDISIQENGNSLDTFINSIVLCSQLPKDTIEDYEIDFNTYVTIVSSLSATMTVRDAINEFLSELNGKDVAELTKRLIYDMNSNSKDLFLLAECFLFLLESIFMNEEDLDFDLPLVELLNKFTTFISYEYNQLLTSRCFLMLPKFFEKFESKLQIETFAAATFSNMVKFASENTCGELTKASVLISSTLYLNLFNSNIKLIDKTLQLALLHIVLSIVEDCEEDTLAVLLEAITFAIGIDKLEAQKIISISESADEDRVSVIDLIFKISFKEPSDIQLTIDSNECLKSLLEDIGIEDYLKNCENSLPFIFKTLQDNASNVDYSPSLSLALELLSIILDSAPNSEIPEQIFQYTFPLTQSLLLASSDDQILQIGGQVFNNLIEKGHKWIVNYHDGNKSGMDILLAVVSKFLSPELSDSAALFSGSIILTVIEKFLSILGNEFLSHILEATVKRLLISKEVITTENLITVFCNLVLSSPDDMINFLANNIRLVDSNSGISKNGLELVLPIWFSTFEIIRGYEHIKKNTLAIGKIFTLGDSRIESINVNGDIIPYAGDAIRTRSMQREQPDQYTQISANLKILKLLVGELSFQHQQPDAKDYLPDNDDDVQGEVDGDDEGDDWEDMDDIGVPNFDKLKSYVDSDAEDEEHDDQNGNEDLKIILSQFFKECTTKNLGNFSKYYELLDDEEKKVISENVIFS